MLSGLTVNPVMVKRVTNNTKYSSTTVKNSMFSVDCNTFPATFDNAIFELRSNCSKTGFANSSYSYTIICCFCGGGSNRNIRFVILVISVNVDSLNPAHSVKVLEIKTDNLLLIMGKHNSKIFENNSAVILYARTVKKCILSIRTHAFI